MTAGTMTPVGVTLPAMPDERDIREALMVLKLVAARPNDPDLWLEFVTTAITALESEPPARPRTESVGDLTSQSEFPERHERRPLETRGAAGYGYRWTADRSGKTRCVAELKTLAEIWDMRAVDGLTLRGIADRLNARSTPSQNGQPWNLGKVKVQLDRLHDDPEIRSDVSPYRRKLS